MPARSNSGKATRSALILVLVGAAVFAATAAYVKFLPQAHVVDYPLNVGLKVDRADDDAPVQPERHVESRQKTTFSVPSVRGDDVVLSTSPDQPAPGEDPAVFLANQSLKAVHADGAKALSVTVKDHVAMIDFSPEIEDGFGSSQEASFIKALQVSLGQLPEVDRFQITVNGQPIDSLGHFELTDPVDVIRPTIKP